jgi:polyhydroxyalkanoate synthesis regulator phasin
MADRKPSRTDAVRNAVDDAFQVAAGQAQSTSRRAQDLVEDLARHARAAGRVGKALDDLRPPSAEELRALRREVQELRDRVAALEQQAAKPDH